MVRQVINIEGVEARRRSVSQINTYLACSEQYRLQRRTPGEVVTQTPAAWFEMGTAIHHVIELWEKWGRQGTIEQARTMFTQKYDELINETLNSTRVESDNWLTGSKKPGSVDIADRRVRGQDHVERYIEHALGHAQDWRIATINGEPAVEVEFKIELGGVPVYGFIDQVVETRDGLIYPRDIKTGTRRPESPLQLAVYAIALNKLFGHTVTTGAYVMTKDKWDNMEHFEPLDQWSEETLANMFYNFDIAERAGVYIPNVGSHCRVCTVKDFCTLMGQPEKAVLAQNPARVQETA